MGSDRARVSFDPSRKWRALVAQQGRVTLEADWNEATSIDADRDRLTTLDVVGPVGTPDGGYAVTATSPTVVRPIGPIIGPIIGPVRIEPILAEPVLTATSPVGSGPSPIGPEPISPTSAGASSLSSGPSPVGSGPSPIVAEPILTGVNPVGPVLLGPPTGESPPAASPPAASPPAATTGRLSVGTGTLYLGGQRLDLDAAVELDSSPQAEWLDQSTDSLWVAPVPAEQSPPASPPGSTNELVYLLAVEQEVSALEDPTLADVALGGPDTMQRVRILQRFVRWPTASSDCTDAWKEVQEAWNTIGLNLDTSTMRLESTAQLQVSFDPAQSSTGPCQPTASGGFLGPENQLIRVQVTSVDPATGNPTVVWGYDDASFLYELESAVPNGAGMAITLAQSPVDQYHYPMAGQSVELLRSAAGLPLAGPDGQSQDTDMSYIASASGFVSSVTSTYNPSQMSLAVSGQPPNDYLSTAATPQLYLRVWQDSMTVPAGTPVDLEVAGAPIGVRITLTSSEGFHPGDFWRFAVRPSVPQLVYPARVVTSAQAPDGARVWACPIALVSWPDVGLPTVTSCVPPFTDLVALTARKGGCCTLNVSPSDIEGGTTLQSLLSPFVGQGPIRVCLSPGTYTLPAPLVLGTEYDGISLEACSPGVVFQAPSDPGAEFVLGLIVVEGASDVTVQGIQFSLPLVPFQPAEGSFAALTSEGVSAANQALLEQFSQVMNVSIGISAQSSSGLVVENCTFDVGPPSSASLFSAGIYASGALEGIQVRDCTFTVDPPPTTAPFYDLVAGNQPPTPYRLTFGYLQVSITGTFEETTTLGQLHDAVIRGCLFEGLTVGAVAVAQLGTLRLENNTVQDCYGGFWLVSLAGAALGLTFDLLPIGDIAARTDLVNLGMTGLADGVFLIASAIARVLPAVPPIGIIIPRIIMVPDPVVLSNAAVGLQTFLGQVVGSPGGSPPSSGAVPGGSPGSPPSSGGTGGAVTTSTGTPPEAATSGTATAVPAEGGSVVTAPVEPSSAVTSPTVTEAAAGALVAEPKVAEELAAPTLSETVATTRPVLSEPIATTTPVVAEPIATTRPVLSEPIATTTPVVSEPIATTTTPVVSEPIATTTPVVSEPIATTTPVVSEPIATTPVLSETTATTTSVLGDVTVAPRPIETLSPTTLATLTTLSTAAPAVQSILGTIGGFRPPIIGVLPPPLPSPPAVPFESDTGTALTLRLDVGDCQIDAIVAESWSGAGLLVADLTSTPGSALVHGNRVRSRFPQGQTALLAGLGEVSVTGNIMANEIATTTVVLVAEASALATSTYSLALHPGTTTLSAPPVAVVGNVFIDLPSLPARSDPSLPSWDSLNAEIPYS
jgi:hypothetical protein